MTFKQDLAEIEKEIEVINDPNKKDISWSDYIEYRELQARKSQLIKDHEAEQLRFKRMLDIIDDEYKLLAREVNDATLVYVYYKQIKRKITEMFGEEKGK